MIAQLQACAASLLLYRLERAPLDDVIALHKKKYMLGVNSDWAADKIEHNRVIKVVEVDGQKFVEIGEGFGENFVAP